MKAKFETLQGKTGLLYEQEGSVLSKAKVVEVCFLACFLFLSLFSKV